MLYKTRVELETGNVIEEDWPEKDVAMEYCQHMTSSKVMPVTRVELLTKEVRHGRYEWTGECLFEYDAMGRYYYTEAPDIAMIA